MIYQPTDNINCDKLSCGNSCDFMLRAFSTYQIGVRVRLDAVQASQTNKRTNEAILGNILIK